MTDKELKAKQQVEKRQRLVVKGIVNRLISRFSLREVVTWSDAYRMTGYDEVWIKSQPNSTTNITIGELRAYCKQLQENLENQIRSTYNEPKADEPTAVKSVTQPVPEVNSGGIKVDKSAGEDLLKEDICTTHTKELSLDESGFNNSSDYGLPVNPALEEVFKKSKSFLFWFQKKCSKEALDKIFGFDISRAKDVDELTRLINDPSVIKHPKRAVLIIASAGSGKTFIQWCIDRYLYDTKWADTRTWGHIKRLAITRNSVVEQTKRVGRDRFGIDPVVETEVINIEKLRTRAGQLWLKENRTIVDGEEVVKWEWKPIINPAVLEIDECQAVKNPDSIQTEIITAYSKLENTCQVYISATPFARVSEARAFAIATKKDISHLGFPAGTKLTADTWHSYASAMSAPSAPDEYNEAAVERLMKDLDDYIVRVKGVRWQFNAINSVEIIDFENSQQQQEYDNAWKKYLAKKAMLEESITDNPQFQAMIELGIFLAAAEYAKRYIFAKRMYQDVQNGYAAVCAVKFKKTIIAVTQILVNDYHASRDQISLIWGGGQTQLTEKQKLKNKIKAHKELFDQAGITMEDMALADVEDRELEDLAPELRLGVQSKDERQREIDKFQSGRSLYCMYTYKAGGVGLSLHHTDELTREKVRRQKNGYAVVEDIPNIPTRPRKVTVGPTWSPMELVQGCGRAPRLTSLSNTIQQFLYFRGTVEEDQAFVVTHRLKCLSKVVRQWETWQDLITNHSRSKEIAKQRVEETKQYESDDPSTEMAVGVLEGEEE